MLAFVAAVVISLSGQEFSKVNQWGPVQMELPLASDSGSKGVFSGSDQGLTFRLEVASGDTSAAAMDRRATEAGNRLKSGPGVRAYRGGSTMPVKFAGKTAWLLRYNLQMQDGREVAADELLLPVATQIYDFTLSAERHDAKAVSWLSRSYASLRADVAKQKGLKLEGFSADGLLWQNWKSAAMRISLLVPHTPYVVTETPTDAEVSRREGAYTDLRYDIHVSAIQYKDELPQSVADLMHADLGLFAVADAKLTKPGTGTSRTIDGAPASLAECTVETSQGIRRLVLLDVVKDHIVYRLSFSAPKNETESSRNIDQMIESIKLLPAQK
jgi:hypothetical protein